MSGRVGDLSAAQEDALQKIREKLSDLLMPEHDDYFLLRFLRARKFDLKKTEKMLRDDFAFRKQYGVDTIIDDYVIPEAFAKFFPGGMAGQDKEGSVIWIDLAGRIDHKGLLRALRKEDIFRSWIKYVEMLCRRRGELAEKQGRRVDQIVLIIDMENFGLKHLWKPGMDLIMELTQISEDHYPENLKKVFVINAPKIFPIIYNLIRPILSEDTVKKIQICGSDYRSVLLKYIDADQLPVHWGGTMTGPNGDPFCSHQICMGGTVPEEYYSQDLSDTSGFMEASIGRGSSLQVEVEVPVARSVIRWQFKTDGYDVGFGVFRKTGEGRQKAGEMKAVLPSSRVNSHLIPEDGSVTCMEPGAHVVRFDNTYSWKREKKLLYLIEVLAPDAEVKLDGQAGDPVTAV